MELFAANGYDDTTVENTAQAAGIFAAFFFRYLSKGDLMSFALNAVWRATRGGSRRVPGRILDARGVSGIGLGPCECAFEERGADSKASQDSEAQPGSGFRGDVTA